MHPLRRIRIITSNQNPTVRSRAGCTKQNSPHQKEEAEELQGRYRPLRVPSSEGPRLALRCDSVLEPLHSGLVGVGHVRAPTTNPCMVRLFASSRIRCPRPWKCGSKWRCQWEPLVEELRMARARTSFGGLPEVVQAFFQLEERFRQWTRRSSPLNPAQTGASSTQGVIGSTTNPNQVLTGKTPSSSKKAGLPAPEEWPGWLWRPSPPCCI